MTETGEFVTEGHLGGYIAGGDPATIYPDLWAWLVDIKDVKSVLDVGCGDGAALRAFRELGCKVNGIDGVEQEDEDIVQIDYSDRASRDNDIELKLLQYDLVWSAEFVEHVEEQFVPYFLEHFAFAPMVLMTHAEPGQPGWHHVNCQSREYWIGAMAAIGYQLDHELTRDTRALAAANTDPSNHYVRSGLAFTRR